MTALEDSIKALTGPVGDVGGRWLLDAEVLGPGRQAGYPNGYAYYVTGRGGVLGDVDADVVTSAFGFFAPGVVRTMWEKGTPVEGPRAAAARYGAACAEFGRSRLAGFEGSVRLAELAGRVASEVDPAGLALFAGWRAEPRPDDAEGRAFLLMHVLRELRGSVHVVACVASGLSPLHAVLATGGAANAKTFGWAEPYPEVDPAAKAPAEALTDSILAGLYGAVLSAAEAAELVTLATSLARHLARHLGPH
jgi:hypothetical protein